MLPSLSEAESPASSLLLASEGIVVDRSKRWLLLFVFFSCEARERKSVRERGVERGGFLSLSSWIEIALSIVVVVVSHTLFTPSFSLVEI